jgi:squalene/oxidosqualene cyclase-like protein
MCYLYCKRFTPDVQNDPLLLSLRKELYKEDYDTVDWDSYRQKCAEIDEYSPLNPVMKIAQDFLSYYEYWLPRIGLLKYLRDQALTFVMTYIHAEDRQTNYVDIGPVNKALNMLSVFVEAGGDTSSVEFQRHIARVDDYIWVAEDGVKMQGYNGSQCWDTSFAVQAIIEGGLAPKFPQCVQKIYSFLEKTQIAEDVQERDFFYRHISKGGWPFSTAAHGWPISDCTAEGLKAVLALHSDLNRESGALGSVSISDERLFDACNIMLSYQNEDGGWATYENNRGYRWYEMLNPSEVFGDIMIDYSYVECSSACVTALKKFGEAFPRHRASEVLCAISAGGNFIKSIQRPDGSWYGSWGTCFTYGTWFGIEGLVAAGEPCSSEEIRRAVRFLLRKQNPNGGWGESYLSCVNKSYTPDGTGKGLGQDGSGVVQTAWAVLGLLAGGECEDHAAVLRGVKFLMDKQVTSFPCSFVIIISLIFVFVCSYPAVTGRRRASLACSIALVASPTRRTETCSRCGPWRDTLTSRTLSISERVNQRFCQDFIVSDSFKTKRVLFSHSFITKSQMTFKKCSPHILASTSDTEGKFECLPLKRLVCIIFS